MADSPNSTSVTEISRSIVEAEIELLIGLLDTLDPDPDLEDGFDQEGDTADDELILGVPDAQTGSWSGINFQDDDREDDPAEDEPELGWTAVQARTGRYGFDDSNAYEPSLASITQHQSGTLVAWGMNDNEEDNSDLEASLSVPNAQAGSWNGILVSAVEDREDECEDEGAQCEDEAAIDCDREPDAEGDFTNYINRNDSDEIRRASQEAIAGLREVMKRHDRGLVVNSSQGLRGVVTRIY